MLQIGSKLGDTYTVLAEIGKGGTSHVYLVLNERAGRQWAVKEVEKAGGGEQGVVRGGLVADADILKKLHHPHISNIVDVMETEDAYYILMEYIQGRNLLEVLREEGAQDQETAVQWMLQICEVLQYLHSLTPKIIYRDTKPQNIMRLPDKKNVVLIDFGAAREYKTHQSSDTIALGSRGYAAPEQYGGMGQTDERTDIYNVGATLYHLLTGHDPTQYPYQLYPIRKWNASLSPELERIILKCTMQNPDERYQTMEELIGDLERYKAVDSGLYAKRKRQMILSAVSAVLGIGLIIGGVAAGKAAENALQSGYDGIMKRAAFATSAEEQEQAYSDAIRLRPGEAEPYVGLLTNTYLNDDIFTREEANRITALLSETSGTQTNEDALTEGTGYGSFAYQMGLAYYYYYEGTGNKQLAQPWLSAAKGGSGLTEAQAKRVEILERIAAYYRQLGQKDKAGDSVSSYAQYWSDLDELTGENIVSADNAQTALVTYQEVVYQVQMHSMEFLKSGIGKDALEEKLQEIETHLTNDFSDNDREYYSEEIRTLTDSIKEARQAMELTYGQGD